jgi:hypothetical protein
MFSEGIVQTSAVSVDDAGKPALLQQLIHWICFVSVQAR